MNIGMLWFDNDPKVSVEVKINRAAIYYRNKYEKVATLCFVHPIMLGDGNTGFTTLSGIEVRTTQSILPNHFWLGIGAKSDK